MFDQDSLDAALLWAIEKLGIREPWKMQELAGGYSKNIVWLIIPENARSVVLRFAGTEQFEQLATYYRALEQASAAGVPVNEPLLCERFSDDLALVAVAYIEGEDGGSILPILSELAAEELGHDAGALLRTIHSLPAHDASVKAWAKRRIIKYERYQDECYQKQLSFADQDRVEAFLEERLSVLAKATISFQHDDFHPRNLIFNNEQLVGVIDFENCDSGDPIEDFYKIPWFTYPVSEAFARGQIDGYLASNPIERFWERYNIYVGMSISSSLVYATRLNDRKMRQDFQYRTLEIVNTHDFTDGGPPNWY